MLLRKVLPFSYHCPLHLSFTAHTLLCCHILMQGKVPILSIEAIHQLHIFIFALAVTHVVLSAVTLILGVTQVFEREASCLNRLITSIF
jgi:hypothetical protein